MKLDGTHVLVTGGASGLGEAVVRRCIADGARVSIFDVNVTAGEALVKDLGGDSKARVYKVNIIDEKSVSESLEAAVAAFGPLRVVVQCAGIATPSRVLNSKGVVHSLAGFQNVVNVNLIGTFNVLRLAVAVMSKQAACEGGEKGVFIHVASVAAFEGQIGQAAYAASKGAVVSMTLPLARELGDMGIRVNTVAPGIFGTPMLRALPEKAQKSLSSQMPFPKRMGEPSEFADCVVHLVTNQYYNGTVVRIDGSIRMAAL